jgi:hypothetical protein
VLLQRPSKASSAVFLDAAAAGQQGGRKLWLTHGELQALLSELLPDYVYSQMVSKLGFKGKQPASPQQIAAAVMAELRRGDLQQPPYLTCSVQDGLDRDSGVQVRGGCSVWFCFRPLNSCI